jgi:UDP-GlcNAc:undecaprenyl-phosphate/decaprenyl-phosphate GlcNAc-1-phosphate transferase
MKEVGLMLKYILIFASALAIAIGTIPFLKRFAVRWGFMDKPNIRKIHSRPVPLLGGVGIYLGFMVALFLFDRFYIQQIVSILVGATFVSFLGLWDDRQTLRPLLKFAGQCLAASIPVLSGIQVHFLHFPILDLTVTFLWIIGITNAMNLLDNMDGLSGGVAMVASIFFFLLAVLNGQYLVGSLTAALLGACIGFLFYNRNPANVFMGDTGSLFIGFILAMVGIKLRFPRNTDLVTWMIPVIVLGLPIFDTSLVVISRWRRGLNPLTNPGKDHLSHRLLAMGATYREVLLILYLVCCGLGVVAMFIMHANIFEAYLVGGLLFILALYSLWRFEEGRDPSDKI